MSAVAGCCLVTLYMFSGSRVIFWIVKGIPDIFFYKFLKIFHCVHAIVRSTLSFLFLQYGF